jgi:hypothetical protein
VLSITARGDCTLDATLTTALEISLGDQQEAIAFNLVCPDLTP